MCPDRRPRPQPPGRVLALLAAGCLAAGCATTTLDGARHQFYGGRVDAAAKTMASIEPEDKDAILYLMERGMVLQQAGAYEESASLLIDAAHRIEAFEAYSISRGAASWVINDTVYRFRGKPYERTLLHAFTAMDFFALEQWDSAAVEARRILDTLAPAAKGDYPDDSFSRYMAGFCFEMIDDPSNAALQYRIAAEHLPYEIPLDTESGRIGATDRPPGLPEDWNHELVFFFSCGRSTDGGYSPSAHQSPSEGPMYADLFAGDQYLGRSYTLVDTAYLSALTAKEDALRTTAKTAARVVAKEALAEALEQETGEQIVGDLVRLLLIGLLEQPDLRGWSTLPRWLQVARVPCPPELDEVEVVVRYRGGREVSRYLIDSPLRRNGRTNVSFLRHLPGP